MSHISKYTILALSLSLLLGSASAQESELARQQWYGVLDVGAAKLRIQVEIDINEKGEASGQAISLDQGNAKMPFDTVTLNDEVLEFSIKTVGAKYSGKLNSDKTVAEGTFEQGGTKFPFKFEKVDKVPTRKHVQTWTGKMKAGFQEFDFQFRVFEDDEKNKTATLDSFTENIEGIPCGIVKDGSKITIEVPIATAPATFVGALEGENKIVGEWEQKDNKYPLTLKQVPLSSTRELKLNRPQTPQPPFDYDSEEVTIENKKDGLTLAGTLTTPKGNGPFPVVVLISGSGPQDRDETLFSHKPFFVIADHLAKNGIGVLRFDDRGTASSTGDFASATSADFANDVESVVEFLKAKDKVDATKIALCGHSEGGLIAPIVASRRTDLAAIVMLAGPGVNGRQIAFNQSRLIAAAAGAQEYEMKINDMLLAKIFEYQDQNKPLDGSFLDAIIKQIESAVPGDKTDEFNVDETRAAIQQAVARTDTPWFKYFATFEPATALSKVKCPVLAIVGEKDLQVDPKLNNPAIEKALMDGGNPDYQVTVLPELNHLFQKCKTGAMSEYNQIEHTIDQSALDLLTDWLSKKLN